MNREKYRQAFDSVKFQADFEAETIEKLRHSMEQASEKETKTMRTKPFRKMIVAIATLAVLIVSASAAVLFLSPSQVAEHAGDSGLTEAFQSEGAIQIRETQQAGPYTIGLEGIVSGKGLSSLGQDTQDDRTYLVTSVAYTDGTPIKAVGDIPFTFSPLISGYAPHQVNAWTLQGGYCSFVDAGILYYLFECDNLEPFADRTVYLAAYESTNVPGPDMFQLHDDGTITFQDTFEKPHALFTLPLDPDQADPAAAKQILQNCGISDD